MKNPFIKKKSVTLWIAATITGALAAGAGIWFYLHGKRAAAQAAEQREHAQAYLEKKYKKKEKQKTGLSELEELVYHHKD